MGRLLDGMKRLLGRDTVGGRHAGGLRLAAQYVERRAAVVDSLAIRRPHVPEFEAPVPFVLHDSTPRAPVVAIRRRASGPAPDRVLSSGHTPAGGPIAGAAMESLLGTLSDG